MFSPSRESQLKALIRRRYARGQADGHARALRAGYAAETLARAPRALVEGWSGCGNLADCVSLEGAKTVVDLGCGSGLDAWLIAQVARPPNTVIALDLTPEVLAQLDSAAGHPRAVSGDMEMLPLADASCDLVIANASFNLALDRRRAFAEAARILRPGGRLNAFDLVNEGKLSPDVLADPMGHGTSLGGVTDERALRADLEAAGYAAIKIHGHRAFPPVTAVQIEARI